MSMDASENVLSVASALFEEVFRSHFSSLHSYACSIIKDEEVAEEVVQNVFCKLWEKQEQLLNSEGVLPYLYRAVHNESLNYLRHDKVKEGYRAYVAGNKSYANNHDPAAIKELQQRIDDALNELPEQCRTIFQLSRLEEQKYRNIAEKLGISVKTVENQVAKAVKLLRNKLAEFLPILLMICISINNLKA
ncbi:MAG: polymerase sigma-70 factor [Flavipsychrobacter sp.]|nr:polymerase sigma-70 factor [Flavipsychrobacter sp.]